MAETYPESKKDKHQVTFQMLNLDSTSTTDKGNSERIELKSRQNPWIVIYETELDIKF